MNFSTEVKQKLLSIIEERNLSLPETEEFDFWKSLTLTRKQTKEILTNREKYKFIPSNANFDFLDLQKNLFYDLKMRIIRFSLTEVSYECIITNLPQDQFSTGEIKQLYAKRWGIETSFRELKYAVGLTHFHSIQLKKEEAPPDVEYLIQHELLPVRMGRSGPRKVKPHSAVSFLYRTA